MLFNKLVKHLVLSESEVISWKTLNKQKVFLCFKSRGLSGNLSRQRYGNMKTFTIGQNRATHHSCCLQCEHRVRDNMKDKERMERGKSAKREERHYRGVSLL